MWPISRHKNCRGSSKPLDGVALYFFCLIAECIVPDTNHCKHSSFYVLSCSIWGELFFPQSPSNLSRLCICWVLHWWLLMNTPIAILSCFMTNTECCIRSVLYTCPSPPSVPLFLCRVDSFSCVRFSCTLRVYLWFKLEDLLLVLPVSILSYFLSTLLVI